MRKVLSTVQMNGVVVIGEGEKDVRPQCLSAVQLSMIFVYMKFAAKLLHAVPDSPGFVHNPNCMYSDSRMHPRTGGSHAVLRRADRDRARANGEHINPHTRLCAHVQHCPYIGFPLGRQSAHGAESIWTTI